MFIFYTSFAVCDVFILPLWTSLYLYPTFLILCQMCLGIYCESNNRIFMPKIVNENINLVATFSIQHPATTNIHHHHHITINFLNLIECICVLICCVEQISHTRLQIFQILFYFKILSDINLCMCLCVWFCLFIYFLCWTSLFVNLKYLRVLSNTWYSFVCVFLRDKKN